MMKSAAVLLTLLLIQGGVSGAKLPHLDSRTDSTDDNSLEPSGKVQRNEWVRLTKTPPLTVQRSVGVPVELECEASGSPTPSIHWLQDNMPITEEEYYESNNIPEDGSTVLGTSISRLIVNNIIPNDKSSYTCVARTGAKTVYSTTYVQTIKGYLKPQNISEYIAMNNEVITAPSKPRIVRFMKTILITMGNTVVLPCKAVGHPHPDIFWLDNNNDIISPDDSRYKLLESGELVIPNLRWPDMGPYTCVAKNLYGKDTAVTFVYPMAK